MEGIAEVFSVTKITSNSLRLKNFASLRENEKSESPKDRESMNCIFIYELRVTSYECVEFLAQRNEKRSFTQRYTKPLNP